MPCLCGLTAIQGFTALNWAEERNKRDVAAALVGQLLCDGGSGCSSVLMSSQRVAVNIPVWLPLLVGVREVVASGALGTFSRHSLYTRDVLRAVMRLSKKNVGR